MSILVPFNGSSFIIPTPNEVGWGTNLDNYLVAIANGCLQNIGGSFTLSNDVDFGGTNGLKSLYYKSRTSLIATTGIVRLANNGDSIAWRNFANTGNHELTVNNSDLLCFDGTPLAAGGSGTVLTGTANTLAYYPASTNVVDDLPAIIASRALQSNASGLPIASSVTSVELGYLSGVTSAIQTQLNLLASNSEPFVTIGNPGSLTNERALTGTASQITITDNGPNSSVVVSLPSTVVTNFFELTSSGTVGFFADNTHTRGIVPGGSNGLVFLAGIGSSKFIIDANGSFTAPDVPLTIQNDVGGGGKLFFNDASHTDNNTYIWRNRATGNLEIVAGNGLLINTAASISGGLAFLNQSAVFLLEQSINGTNFVAHKAADALSTDSTYKWPVAPASTATLQSDSSGNLSWVTGALPAVQIVTAQTNTPSTPSSTTFVNSNLSVTITPTTNTSKIYIFVTGQAAAGVASGYVTISRGSTNLFPNNAGGCAVATGSGDTTVSMQVYDSPATTSPVTYNVQLREDVGGSIAFPTNFFSPVPVAYITAIEYLQ